MQVVLNSEGRSLYATDGWIDIYFQQSILSLISSMYYSGGPIIPCHCLIIGSFGPLLQQCGVQKVDILFN